MIEKRTGWPGWFLAGSVVSGGRWGISAGEPEEKRIRRKTFDLNRAASWNFSLFLTLCWALEYIHDTGCKPIQATWCFQFYLFGDLICTYNGWSVAGLEIISQSLAKIKAGQPKQKQIPQTKILEFSLFFFYLRAHKVGILSPFFLNGVFVHFMFYFWAAQTRYPGLLANRLTKMGKVYWNSNIISPTSPQYDYISTGRVFRGGFVSLETVSCFSNVFGWYNDCFAFFFKIV